MTEFIFFLRILFCTIHCYHNYKNPAGRIDTLIPSPVRKDKTRQAIQSDDFSESDLRSIVLPLHSR